MTGPGISPAADRFGIAVIVAVAVAALVLLVAPSVIVVIISFDTRGYVSFPPEGFTFDWYRELFRQTVLVESMWNSLKVGVMVTILCIVLGVPTALACARGRFRGTTALSVYVMAPHMVPGIVLGTAVLFAGALVGVSPSIWLQSISIAVFVLAVMVRTVTSRLQRLDPALEEAATNLGASSFQALRTITFPLLLPAILAGAVFTFVEGFDNLSVAIFTHGFRDRPLPIELLALVQNTSSPLVAAVSGFQILLAIVALVAVSMSIGLDKVNE
ncbi:ABC transporter permease [Acuticoccus sp. I52.16.1]|uniref:ABC transporter permease n=1 Tax=Acuticoccus sp. I52.16.1 TaxID=2928472 RepID=UPI001FD0C4EA|nr:ABC transporter permease [Acuticoccus sp. I52.16.1]UOM35239.1 ABC transporter permease [Acuticoccus sp. I52.16.1]